MTKDESVTKLTKLVEQTEEQKMKWVLCIRDRMRQRMTKKKLSFEQADEGVSSQGSGEGIVAVRQREVGQAFGAEGAEFGELGAEFGDLQTGNYFSYNTIYTLMFSARQSEY